MAGDLSAVTELAAYLTGTEARQLADRLEDGQTLTSALVVVPPVRRGRARTLIETVAGGRRVDELTIAVLRAVEGALSKATSISPVWTAPQNLIGHGQLTASIRHLVTRARESVTCSTYNFQRSSSLWEVLAEVARRPEVNVRIYVDTSAADAEPRRWSPTTQAMAAELVGATILRTVSLDGRPVRNHAKFIAVDHQDLIVTSANFSRSAEHHNVELGLQIENPLVAQAVERQMHALEEHCYEVVRRQ